MKPIYILTFLFLIQALYSCHKSQNSNSPYLNNIIKSHNWTGYFNMHLASPVSGVANGGYSVTAADTAFAFTAGPGGTVIIGFVGFPLKYISTDPVVQTVTYDSSINSVPYARLVYYYELDSMTLYYYDIVGSLWGYDDPYMITDSLHSIR